MVNKEEMLRMAELAKLRVSEDELGGLVEELNMMIESIDKIKEVDTEGVEPTYNVNDFINPLREDLVEESLSAKEVLKNTVEEQYGYFKILRVMD